VKRVTVLRDGDIPAVALRRTIAANGDGQIPETSLPIAGEERNRRGH
jgi:hypothetical protein